LINLELFFWVLKLSYYYSLINGLAMKKLSIFIVFTVFLNIITMGQTVTRSEYPDMNTSRMGAQIVKGNTGIVTTLGGHTFDFVRDNTSCSYNFNSQYSYQTLLDFRDFSGIVHLKDSTCLLVGGMSSNLGVGQLQSTEKFNPKLLNSVVGPNLLFARAMANGAQLNDGRVLVMGCWYDNFAAGVGEVLDLATNSVIQTGAVTQGRAYPTIVATSDGKALAFGGWGVYGGANTGNVEIYDPQSNSFTMVRNSLFEGDDSYTIVSDFGEDNQNRVLPNGKLIFLAKKLIGSDVKLFTVDPVTKIFELFETSLPFPVIEPVSGNNFSYLSPSVDLAKGLIIIPQVWEDLQQVKHVNLLYVKTGDANKTLVSPSTSINLTYWPTTASRTLMSYPESGKAGIIFFGGNLTNNFDAVPNVFAAVLNFPTGINDEVNIPNEFSLMQNFPNPFNPSTVIEFSIPEAAFVKIAVYDITGKEIAIVASDNFNAGKSQVSFDASKLGSGVYFYTLQSGGRNITKKMTLLR
jgi:hypothetical protein